MKKLGEKTGVLVGLDMHLVGEEIKQGSDPHTGQLSVREETFKAENETADLW